MLLFSIIVPTCNRNDMLALCLDRLAPGMQTLDAVRYEVIVTDDGKNNEAKVLIETRYPWVQWTAGPKRGPAANRNNGARLAQGRWLVFTDDDCLPDSRLLQGYFLSIQNNKEIFVYEGRTSAEGTCKSPLMHAPINETGGLLWSCNFCILKTLFCSVRGFDENFRYPHLEDIDLKERLQMQHEAIRFVPDSFVLHPWRIIINGKKLGKMHESDIYYYQHKKGIEIRYLSHVRKIITARLKRLIKFPLRYDSFILLKALFIELIVFSKYYSSWKRKYRPGK